jgi:cytochrome c oxidase cbb3-type subunit III
MRAALALAFGVALMLIAGCKREEREYRSSPPLAAAQDPTIPMSVLAPGGRPVATSSLKPGDVPRPSTPSRKGETFQKNAYHLSEGKRLFSWFNCTGCHAHGGGGSGPALMDDAWLYGSSIDSIAASIREGRPNGMPAFHDKIVDDQIWQLAAYVRSMQRSVPKSAAPGRSDHLMGRPAENRIPYAVPYRPPRDPAPKAEPPPAARERTP